ncbi:MAG: hypothetical protein US31_C0017G0016 [Berkelbacteria bacterium GW2011_GWA1_36_9]|uniref:DUF378 domain-containing protein n=1 Tax=Berkelbacteria bacterium GW2011_GWA1_36_9 TaxID=1618331 RepID=A0A0G0FIK0_9BACT|nr:MAG: hypothetical protein US31_C0017G0016 [Berkelbacteria bacterium GW2011_GWA1_36_9]
MKKDMGTLGWIAFVLVIVGALNWLLVGVFNWNLVQAIFGGIPIIESIIYILVGIGALYLIFTKK